MNTTTRPEIIDEHGVTHRPGCNLPGWTSAPASLRGWHVLRCPECGAVRLVRGREVTT
ncbi:hypothetical protein ACVW07_000642 [Cellulomonas sp. URHB0016]